MKDYKQLFPPLPTAIQQSIQLPPVVSNAARQHSASSERAPKKAKIDEIMTPVVIKVTQSISVIVSRKPSIVIDFRVLVELAET